MNGTILANRYLLDAQIGAGGMGAVYRATDLRTGGAVAVKFLHAVFAGSGEFAERLQREAQLAASLTSPRVVRVIDLDTHGGAPFLVMEYVAGPTLHDLLDETGRLPPAEAVRIALEVARALEAAHARGIVHRDLKPQNIKLVEGQVKVLDFGIARAEGYEGMTSASTFMGTPEYSAPEQLEGRADIRADIYAVGLLLYRMVEGRLPFIGPTPLAVLNMQASAPLPPAAAAPPALAAVIDHCLEKRPEDRYQTPAELVAALHGVTLAAPGAMAPLPVDADGAATLPRAVVGARPPDGGASTAPPSGAGERRPPPRPSRRRLLVGAL